MASRYPPPRTRNMLALGFHLSGDLDRPRLATRTGRPYRGKGFVVETGSEIGMEVGTARVRSQAEHPDRRGLRRPLRGVSFVIGPLARCVERAIT